jgi:hypothetical protein
VRKVDEIFSKNNENLKGLFRSEDDFLEFLKVSRRIVFSKKEYFLIAGMLIVLLLTNSSFVDLTTGKAIEILHVTPAIDLLESCYSYVYWAVIAASFVSSMIWTILGISVAMFMLGRERKHMKISRTIAELKKTLRNYGRKEFDDVDFSSFDFSFGNLKDGLNPLVRMVHELSVTIAGFGLLYSTPAIIYFFATHDISPNIYYGFCVFTAALSCLVLFSGEIGIRGIWTSSKDDALVMLEQLCDRVKFECMKSIVSSQDHHSRENLQKDVTFIRATIDDLKTLKASGLTMSSVVRIFTTIVLPYIPLITKLLGLY